MAQTVQMTTEQLQQLIDAVRVSVGNASVAKSKTMASFSDCPVGFGGQRELKVVEEFINTVVTYKEINGISDEDALKETSMLFFSWAWKWWQGVRNDAKNWNDVLTMIREHFAPTPPAYQIYMEFFEKKQDKTTDIDPFVLEKRAMLAQLPEDRHIEELEIDMIYGLLNIKYRKYIARKDIKTFQELLEKGRRLEQNMVEVEAAQLKTTQAKAKVRKRCTYCNFKGHTNEECRKRKAAEGVE